MQNAALFLLAVVHALLLGGAWFFPGGTLSAVLGWLAGFSLLALLRNSHKHRLIYLSGILTYLIGFYWLRNTITHFGGFGFLAGAAIYALFIVVSATQYLILSYCYKNLPLLFTKLGLRFACAWIFAETVRVSIFPWMIGHTQIAFLPFAQIADIGGASLVSFVMCWLIDGIQTAISERRVFKWQLFAPCLAMIASIIYGAGQINYFSSLRLFEKATVNLVQGNISLEAKHDRNSSLQNIRAYQELSLGNNADLVIWPESAVMEFIFNQTTHLDQIHFLDQISGTNLLLGSLSYDQERQIYNSAFAIHATGQVLAPYHKRILMPFGEYTPFGEWFPWIKEINSTAPDFVAGQATSLFEFKTTSGSIIKAAPLICYEDVIESLASEATLAGANLLVNLTNDAWFGDSPAPNQHNLIASFRAIENRRFLLRSTNSGLTSIINALGETSATIPHFTRSNLVAPVDLISYKSTYNSFAIRPIHYLLLTVIGICLLLSSTRSHTQFKK